MPLLMEACPSYRPTSDDEDSLSVTLGDFADHLWQLQQQSRTQEFPEVARAIEHLHIEGDHYVREAATMGLLEGIQNGWANKGADPELFGRHLLPVSAKWWKSLNDFWSGRSKFVGEGAMRRLTEIEFRATFAEPMQPVPAEAAPPVPFWDYFEAIPIDDFAGHDCSAGIVDRAWTDGTGAFQHVLINTEDNNIFMVVVLDLRSASIVGHHLLELGIEYGLEGA